MKLPIRGSNLDDMPKTGQQTAIATPYLVCKVPNNKVKVGHYIMGTQHVYSAAAMHEVDAPLFQ